MKEKLVSAICQIREDGTFQVRVPELGLVIPAHRDGSPITTREQCQAVAMDVMALSAAVAAEHGFEETSVAHYKLDADA